MGAALVLFLVACGCYLFARYDSKYTLVMTALFAVFLAAIILVRHFARWGSFDCDVPYVVTLCLTGLAFFIVFAPGTVPDEIYHFNAAYKYTDVWLGQETTDSSIAMRTDDLVFETEVLYSYHQDPNQSVPLLNRSSYRNTIQHASLFVDNADTIQQPVDSSYPIESNVPQLKLPSAIGILIARLLNLGAVPLFYLGRLFNFAYFVVLAVAAVRLTPVGRGVFKAISLLPMTLHLAASYSYDAGTIGLAMLFSALALRAILAEGRLGRSELVALACSAIALAPCKVIYSLLLILLFFIPAERFCSRRWGMAFKLGIVFVSFLVVVGLRYETFLNLLTGETEATTAQIKYEGVSEYYSLSSLLFNPVGTILLMLRTLEGLGDMYVFSMVGTQLAWFQGSLYAPDYVGIALLFLLAVSTVCCPEDDAVLPRGVRVALVSAFLVFVVALLFQFAISWTEAGADIIAGVQGRYFIPVLPLLLLALRGGMIRSSVSLVSKIEIAESLIGLLVVLRVFAIALTL